MIDINQVQRDFDNGVMLCRETIRQVIELAGKQAKDAARWQYVKATTTAIRDPETGGREECTPEQFEQAVDIVLAKELAANR